ncbi:ATP-binding protein [Amphritea sp. 2_MG-2023]|uniref:AAA family ATPase n=1 Tax=Amphritea TaxID=515417 RepID=UPI001C076B14|nr:MULTISPECIES: ATP-binding protein [Amphritea]MBU2967087.1 ATP-binding protein [Amphritea atlantica]MDO6419360.1 ATP-binding protein [Amphritea sp. 2_MG-2023]
MTSINPHVNGGIANIANIGLCDVALEKAIERTSSLPGMVCLYGPSGFGKSVAATYVANRRRAYYVQAKSVWTKKHTLAAILAEMGIRPLATIPEMLDQAAQELAMSGRPLIVDEMDHLVDKNAVELIRDLYEASQSPILLIGEEQLPSKLKRWERFHGRVLSWVPAQPVTLADARKLVPLYAGEVQIEDDLLEHLVELSGGSVRRVAVNLEMIQDTALTSGWESVDRAVWGKTALYTGEAPKRRL